MSYIHTREIKSLRLKYLFISYITFSENKNTFSSNYNYVLLPFKLDFGHSLVFPLTEELLINTLLCFFSFCSSLFLCVHVVVIFLCNRRYKNHFQYKGHVNSLWANTSSIQPKDAISVWIFLWKYFSFSDRTVT